MKRSKPHISVIVPVYNGEKTIGRLLDSIETLRNEALTFEVLVVDNNSTDQTVNIVNQYPVKLLEFKDFQSSYAARNTGIYSANGSIVAFTDCDCIADKNWLQNIWAHFQHNDLDFLAGQIDFTFSQKPTLAEQWDAYRNLSNEKNMKLGFAATANLAVRRSLFDQIGLFPEVTSGGDFIWTNRAEKFNVKSMYAKDVIVYHKARKLKQLLNKSYRVGLGRIAVLCQLKWSTTKILFNTFTLLTPISIKDVVAFYKESNFGTPISVLKMIWMAYLCNLCEFFGILSSLKAPSSSLINR